jgi:hypothetical protein
LGRIALGKNWSWEELVLGRIVGEELSGEELIREELIVNRPGNYKNNRTLTLKRKVSRLKGKKSYVD